MVLGPGSAWVFRSLPHAELLEAGRFLTSPGRGRAWVLGPGSAWVWVLAPIASRPVRISLLVFGTHLPSECFLFRWIPLVRVARSRSCSLFMFGRMSASGAGKELAVPGSSLQDAAPGPKRPRKARDTMSTLEDGVACAMDAATALRSDSASSLPARGGPWNTHDSPSTLNLNRTNHPGFGQFLRTVPS